jgi:hypothetical protein
MDLERTLDLYGPLSLYASAWIALAGLVALAAGRRGYNPYVWFLGCIVLSPVVGFALLALLSFMRGGPHRPA